MLARDPDGLSLRTDPSALAPERLLVFELRGSVASFAAAINKVHGLELIDEEALASDDDESPVAYLLVPDARALAEIESLWRRWLRHEPLKTGWTAWRDVFALLRALRPWGPEDRVDAQDVDLLAQDIDGRADDVMIRLELELVFWQNKQDEVRAEQKLRDEIERHQGRVIARSRITEIAYHALLVEVPVTAVREIVARSHDGIAAFDPIMHIRPQSHATTFEVADPEQTAPPQDAGALGEPILALLDGVPMARHRLLEHHLIVDDMFGLEAGAQVADRKHGTAMASLIVHGDRNRSEQSLRRKIHLVPVLAARPGANESFADDRLIVDTVYGAIRAMREGPSASAPQVLIVNLSLGNRRQPFHKRLSAWARLLDRLAYQYGILFVISAGNIDNRLALTAFATRTAFEDAEHSARSVGVLSAIAAQMAERKLFAPAESVNGIAIGACNDDAVPPNQRQTAVSVIDPHPGIAMSNPSSALGPGYASAVKPDLLMPGSRERLMVLANHPSHIDVKPAGPSRAAGLKVAAPPHAGQENFEGYTNGTSAAAALASRACHRIHDALEAAYGRTFLDLPQRHRAVLLKALLAHTAQWPSDTAEFIKQTLGPADSKQHVKQKDNIRRFLGYGMVDADSAVACADDRATFWAVGEIKEKEVVHVPIPIPGAINGKAQPHLMVATVAWFTPTRPGCSAYRAVRLKLLEPEDVATLGAEPNKGQPDSNQSNRGTLFNRRWEGSKAPAVGDNMVMRLHIQREPDQAGMRVDEPIPFGLAVTITMPGVVEIYEEVRQRLGILPPVRAR